MTTVVYIGSAVRHYNSSNHDSMLKALTSPRRRQIYTPSEQGLAEEYGVALVVTVLGLSLFIVGYGIGPSKLFDASVAQLQSTVDEGVVASATPPSPSLLWRAFVPLARA